LRMVAGRWQSAGDIGTRALPATLDEVIRARLALLPAERLTLLQKLAHAGRLIDLRLAREYTRVGEQAMFETLDEAIERQFVTRALGRQVEVGYFADPPTCLRCAARLFQQWDQSDGLIARGRAEVDALLAEASQHKDDAARKRSLHAAHRTVSIDDLASPRDIF